MDSHPPLSARVEKARSLAIATASEDNQPAVTLFKDLPRLEIQLLTRLMPALRSSELRPAHWDTVGAEVYVPLWRGEIATLASNLSSGTMYTLPNALANLNQLAGRIPDPPGTLLTRDQRFGRASAVMGHAMTLALIDHGWKIYFQPGQFFVESENGNKMDPQGVIQEFLNGNRRADTWLRYCHESAVGDWPLIAQSAEGR